MCNSFRSRVSFDQLKRAFGGLQWSGAESNLEPRESVRITETAPIIRLAADGSPVVQAMRWSWPGPTGKPLYNFRSEGRRFASGRCLIPSDGFYEYTDPPGPALKGARKCRWLFTLAGEPWFCMAGVWRVGAAAGEDAFTLLTTEPGPDIAPYHRRQVIPLGPEQWSRWLRGPDAEALLSLSPAGTMFAASAQGAKP